MKISPEVKKYLIRTLRSQLASVKDIINTEDLSEREVQHFSAQSRLLEQAIKEVEDL